MKKLCLIILALFFIQGCAATTTKVYNVPFQTIHKDLTKYFYIQQYPSGLETDVTTMVLPQGKEGGLRDIDTDNTSLRILLKSHKPYGIVMYEKPTYEVMKYIPEKKIVIQSEFYYMFGGSYGLKFNVERINEDVTAVEVDYFDSGNLLIVTITKSGKDEEEFIHNLLFGDYKETQNEGD